MAVPFNVIALVPVKLMEKKRETYCCDKCEQLCWISPEQLKAKAEDKWQALCSECLEEYGVKFSIPKGMGIWFGL